MDNQVEIECAVAAKELARSELKRLRKVLKNFVVTQLDLEELWDDDEREDESNVEISAPLDSEKAEDDLYAEFCRRFPDGDWELFYKGWDCFREVACVHLHEIGTADKDDALWWREKAFAYLEYVWGIWTP